MRVVLLMIALCIACSCDATAQTSRELIARAEAHVTSFLSGISEVKCAEQVDQLKLGKAEKIEYQHRSRFDYLLIAEASGDELSLQESRLEEEAKPVRKNVPLLVTNGFATMLLVFHPYYQAGFEFSPPEDVSYNGGTVARMQFRHISGMRTPTALVLRGREYPLEMSGTAWIDKESGAILRMETRLQTDMSDIGLKTLHSDVTYSPQSFRGMNTPMWLPKTATIEVETPRQRWRNVHQFTDYQHFGVETQHQEKLPEGFKNPQ